MKILIFDNSAFNIIEGDFCCEPKTGLFVTELQALGHEVIMFGQILETDDTVLTYKLKEKGISVVALKRKRNKIINYILLYLRAIPEIIKSDFVYIFYPNAFKYIALLCVLLFKKYGLYIRAQQRLNDKASHLIYKKAFTVFTVSEKFTHYVNSIAEREVSNTVRPMIPFTEKDIIKNRDYNVNNKFKILFLGRIVFDKGIEELLNALKILKDKNYKLDLTVVGNGAFLQTSKQIANKLNIDDIVFFVGSEFEPEKIRNYYINSDIFILPSYNEGFPRTLYEAMIFGTPIITTFVGGIPTLMINDYNCKEILPKSIDSIVEGLESAINNYSKMVEYTKNATYTVEKIVDSKRPTHAQHLNKIIN